MILFRCPACGTAHRAEPQYAGGMLPCRRCGQQVPIPHASDPACALVYKAGESDDGLPMTMEEIRVKLVAGELADTDLVWDSSTWKPLSQAFGAVREGENTGLRLKHREDDSATAGDKELGTPLVPLGAVQKVAPAALADGAGATKSRRFQLRRRQEPKAAAETTGPAAEAAVVTAPAAAAPAPAADPAAASRSARRHGRLYQAGQVVLLVLALFFGFKLGVGPLISQFRDRPTYVIVQNHEAIDYTAALGMRRIKEDLYKNGLANYQVWVGLPERMTLRITPTVPGTAEPYKVKVPVRPGAVTLVNLKALGEYGVYDLTALSGKKLDTAELKDLAAEIGANRAPASAIKVSRQVRDLVGPAFIGTRQDLFYRSAHYEFDPSLLYRQRQHELDRERAGKAAKKAKTSSKNPKPHLAFPAARVLTFTNGSSLYHPTDREKVERTVTLPTTTLNLSGSRILKVAPPKVTLTGDAKAIALVIQLQNTKVTAEGKSFLGTWDYRATCRLEGKDANRWVWSWVFRGLGSAGNKRYNLELRVGPDGKETVKVTPA